MTDTHPSQALSARPLTLAERIDLDALLAVDAAADESHLRSRDGAIGRRAAAGCLPDERAVRAYLRERLAAGTPSAGSVFTHCRRVVSIILLLGGLLVGFTTVGGWLVTHSGRPVNVIHFWAAIVGIQLLLLIALVVALVRLRRWGRSDTPDTHQRARPTLLAAALTRVLVRLAERNAALADQHDRLAASIAVLRATYGRTLTWIGLRLTQSFAIAFNVGAIVALLLFSLISDPAFGWRSTLLNPDHVHTISRVVAAPFSFTGWGAPPDPATIGATRYYSLEGWSPSSDEPAQWSVWSAWFAFLFASIVVYGLVPRLLVYTLCGLGESRSLVATSWRTAAADRLLRRLRRPVVSTTADAADTPDAPPTTPASFAPTTPPHSTATHSGPITLLRWSGVKIDDDALLAAVAARLHAQPVTPILAVGALDLAADRAAIDRAASHPAAAAALIVEGWEPPVADHLDLLRQLRAALGPSRLIHVLIAGLSRDHRPAGPTAAQLATWRSKLAALPDAYLAVEPLVEPAA